VVFNEEAVQNLNSQQLTQLQSYANMIQSSYDQQLEMFSQLQQEELRIAKEANDKKKKVYEDYFKALDRLENKRERKLTREQIVQQLQRLEGATDSASKQKAKELRGELIKFDEDTRKEEQKQAREDLIKSLDDELIKIEEK
jgi:hypothetical protein